MQLLLVDDHEVLRSGLRMLLESQEDIQIVGEAGTAAEALEAVARLEPEVILLDIGLPDMSGIQVMERIRDIEPELAVVALTIHEDKEYFFKMLDAGAEWADRAGTGGVDSRRRWGHQCRNRARSRHKSENRGPTPGKHHGQAELAFADGVGQVRDSKGDY